METPGSRRLLLVDLLAQALFLLSELRGEFGAKVLRLEDLANLNLGSAVERGAFEPLDRLVHRPDLPQPKARDQLFGFGEGAVDHGALGAREADALALRAGLQP